MAIRSPSPDGDLPSPEDVLKDTQTSRSGTGSTTTSTSTRSSCTGAASAASSPLSTPEVEEVPEASSKSPPKRAKPKSDKEKAKEKEREKKMEQKKKRDEEKEEKEREKERKRKEDEEKKKQAADALAAMPIEINVLCYEYGSKTTAKPFTSPFFELARDDPYDTFCAQVLVKVDSAFQAKRSDLADYILEWTIPRNQPTRMQLRDEDDFEGLLKKLAAKAPKAAIHVKPKKKDIKKRAREDSDDEDSDDEDGGKTKKKKKLNSRKPTESKIDPKKKKQIEYEQQLLKRWACMGQHPGRACFIYGHNSTHLLLNMDLTAVWCEALDHNPPTATLDEPPHHDFFSMVTRKENSAIKESALLVTRRAQIQKTHAAPAPPAAQAPVTVVFQGFPGLPASASGVAMPAAAARDETSLIPPGSKAGAPLTMDVFCARHGVPDPVKTLLVDNGFDEPTLFGEMVLQDVKELRDQDGAPLRAGDLFKLRRAIKEWSIPSVQ